MRENTGKLAGGIFFLFCLCLNSSGCGKDGALLFRELGCINCHSFQGQGGAMGPDLTAVSARMSREEIGRYIKNPEQENPGTRMPAFADLGKGELQAIIDFLDR